MNFINEQDGLPLAQSQLVLRLLDHLSHLTGGRAGRRQRDEASRAVLFTGAGDNVRKGGLKDNMYKVN